ncbi:MAG: MFS transporter [Verrucomicrobiota bacterium]
MAPLKRQFFFSFGVIGSVMPLMTVFLREQVGFEYLEIGFAMALMNVPMLCSPVILTLLADRSVDARRILAIAFACSAVVLAGMAISTVVWITLGLFLLHGLAFFAMLPLQDAHYFRLAEKERAAGSEVTDYPYVRVWGTVGFIVPSLLLFIPLANGASTQSILPCAVGFAILSLLNSFTLPPAPSANTKPNRLPTRLAFGALFSPSARWLCIGLFIAFLGSSTYYAFIGNFMSEVAGVPNNWIGIIINIGVTLEIGFTLLMPWVQRKIRLKGILVLGLGYMALRMFVMAWFPIPAVVIIAQLGHGLEILALYIGPIMFIDRLASAEFRSSIQGVFMMTVGGLSKIFGGVLSGLVVTWSSLTGALMFGGAMALAGALIVAFLFRQIPPRDETAGNPIPSP